MSCCNKDIPIRNDFCFFVYGVNELVVFWVDQNGESTPISGFTGALFRFRDGRRTTSEILLDIIGTIEDRVDDDMVSKPAMVFYISDSDKETLLGNFSDIERDGTIYLTKTLNPKPTPVIHGLHTIKGGA
jgi:hypothetical protein